MLRKDLDYFVHRAGEGINLFLSVIESEGGARRRGHVEVLHDGLRAVMPGAYGDPLLIENRANVVRVYFVNHERENARLLARVADDADALDCRNLLGRVGEKLLLVSTRRGTVERVQIINRRAESDLRSDCGRARLELVGDRCVGAALERHGSYHRAAAEKRIHPLKQLGPPV